MAKRVPFSVASVVIRNVLTGILAVTLALAMAPVAALAEEASGDDAQPVANGESADLSAMAIPSDPDAKELQLADVTPPSDQVFSGFPLIPEPIVRDGDTILSEGTDYEVQYVDNTDAGTATVYITGEWHYTGTVAVTFEIAQQDIANADVKASWRGYVVTYNGYTLVEERDYTIERDGDTPSIVGKGNFFGSRTVPPLPDPVSFIDVTSATAHYNEVYWLAEQGISEGWLVAGGREFRPYDEILRADMAAFLFRLARSWGLVTDDWQPSGSVSFTDVNSQTAHYREVMWLAESKISEGWPVDGGREFRPFSKIVRADMAAFLCRLATLAGKYEWAEPARMGFFCDVNGSTAHVEEVMWLAGSKISEGWGSGSTREFRPHSTALRADMAAFLYRLDNLTESGDPDDPDDPYDPIDDPDDPVEDMVLITKTGTKYHRLSGCRSTAGKPVTQISLADALARGYEPCKNCYH